MYLCKFGENPSTSSKDNARKPYFGHFQSAAVTLTIWSRSPNLFNYSPPTNNVSMQVWSKKQLKRNVCVPKSNSNDRYANTCDVIAYHLVHFVFIWVINKCQSGIDFFLLVTQYNSSFMNKTSVPSPVFLRKTV